MNTKMQLLNKSVLKISCAKAGEAGADEKQPRHMNNNNGQDNALAYLLDFANAVNKKKSVYGHVSACSQGGSQSHTHGSERPERSVCEGEADTR